MDVTVAVEVLRERLAAIGDPASARAQKTYLKSSLEFHGVKAADLRTTARGFWQRHPDLPSGELWAVVESLWATPYHDLRSLGIALLEARPRALGPDDLARVESLLERSSTWDHVDYLATRVAAPLVARFPELASRLEVWAVHPSFWLRRAALVTLMPELRRGAGHLELFERLAGPMLEERELFIRKALGWVLREVGKRRPERVRRFLERHLDRVSGLTLREAVKYLPEGDREGLFEKHRSRAQRRPAATAYHLRRHDKALEDRAELDATLARTRWVTLAMCRDDDPYLVVVNHGYDPSRRCLYFHCAADGRKMEVLRANPRVWGIAVQDLGYLDGECDHAFRSVMFGGRVTFLDTDAEKREALEVMIRQLESRPGPVMARTLTPARLASVTVGRVDLEVMTGKQALPERGTAVSRPAGPEVWSAGSVRKPTDSASEAIETDGTQREEGAKAR